jgi:uncharacterized protein
MMVTDAGLVKKILDGDADECSCGYTCEILPGGGEWNGQPYDTEQTKIRGNHVAIVPAGRAGPAARVKLDAGDAVALPRETARGDETKEIHPMKKIKIHGIECELPVHVCDAIEAERAATASSIQARIDALGLATVTARADAAEAEVVTLKKAVADSAAASPALVAEALIVVDVARRAGVDVKVDALDLPAVKRAVAEKVNGVKLDGKSADYVAAAFDIAKGKIDASATGAILLAVVDPKVDGVREDEDEGADGARARMAKRNADAWKPAGK